MDRTNKTTELTENGQGDRHEEVAFRAYLLWQERGSPLGSPEEDWFRAEQEVSSQQAQFKAA
ncbi:MAG TPA: DUF2934 domain-containing protein [Terriglobia bacterium]|nr:DUF2934 domain-containing protein [Terriglobia bacterium]